MAARRGVESARRAFLKVADEILNPMTPDERGVVVPGEVRSMTLPDAMTAKLGDGAGLVLTREPLGGKPDGVDAGPVVAKGTFSRV